MVVRNTQATFRPGAIADTTKTLSVFMQQVAVSSEAEGKKQLREAKKANSECLGGRVIPTSARNRRAGWMLQLYFVDDGKTPPRGMARLTIPAGTALDYGINDD